MWVRKTFQSIRFWEKTYISVKIKALVKHMHSVTQSRLGS